ncbi:MULTISPECIES: secondary thiamine-phosphate synthase enzyme YjbQ [unclassified Oceanobacter]|uniref:secondary thiamine-phosphate synthase enzyme YjbQ n=1 Tax=unclassified Oceanobacter TaxID=2620260 RepID=UPI00273644F2|nr:MULTISPECIES: secondary thiamine-phosphate synthase enzyme YjbQ [unclassified Oceanobacter]MDP2608270.1 secondary thiamine-phosphate synthase enzyme YjbQ [Oceanobacter sp. 1_MG-2023]MDP2612155.1 secondary thiamine-phosphate synthase enzyme YjbQ [Oceanobacter sp. 2_MG-2023]
MWLQKEIRLSPRSRGFHLITEEIRQQLPELASIDIGLLQLFIQHTSASLTINENADPTVRQDMEAWFHRNVREDEPYYRHTLEGSDDLPAHIKASLLGHSVTIPITGGELNMGIWQGIYLGEHRHQGGSRRVLATLQGQGR